MLTQAHEAGMLKRWRRAQPGRHLPADAVRLAHDLGVHPLVGLLLQRRGCDAAETARAFLDPRLTRLHDPALLPGAARAAQRLEQAVRDRQPIVIYGDYDVDGITASAILWHVLTLAGGQVSTYVPHRIDEGYGLNCEAVQKIAICQVPSANCGDAPMAHAAPDTAPIGNWRSAIGSSIRPLLITVDCGITAIEPARVAAEAGMDLIITDHHEFDPAHLPQCHTLVHPRLTPADGPTYPFPDLCGAGVALKLAWQFAKVHCGSERVPAEFRRLLLDMVSLAALGTVADVVPLVDENRVLTTHGLGQIKHTGLPGLNALIDAAGLREERVDAYHVGFVLGPRLNACGRMGHAAKAVHLLTSAPPREALEIAQFLSKENDRRRATEKVIFEEARQMVVQAGYDRPDCRVIVLGREGWHAGVVGIVASRLVDEFCRPVVLLCYDNGEAHGSARSIDGFSIHKAFVHCAAHLASFGGHAMAAGLRLAGDSVEGFRAALVEYANAHLDESDLTGVLDIDADCAIDDLTLTLCQEIQRLAPFGRGNPAPVLCLRQATLDQAPLRMGNSGKHLRLSLRSDRRVVQAVWFSAGDQYDKLPAGTRLDVVFEPKLSTWQGQERMDLHVRDVRLL